jgi:glucokinase
MTSDRHGPPCRCSNHGCLEAYAGGWAIAERAHTLIRANKDSGATLIELAGGSLYEVTTEHVAEAFHRGDQLACDLVGVAVDALIAGCITVTNALSPARIIFGGGVIEGIPELIERIEPEVKKRALPAATERLQLVKAVLGDDAGVIGAAALAREVRRGKEGKTV